MSLCLHASPRSTKNDLLDKKVAVIREMAPHWVVLCMLGDTLHAGRYVACWDIGCMLGDAYVSERKS